MKARYQEAEATTATELRWKWRGYSDFIWNTAAQEAFYSETHGIAGSASSVPSPRDVALRGREQV